MKRAALALAALLALGLLAHDSAQADGAMPRSMSAAATYSTMGRFTIVAPRAARKATDGNAGIT